jgi:hypothetical protein
MFGVCDPNTCNQPPVGACCDPATGDCVVVTQAACPFTWLGAGVPCNTQTCPLPPPLVGACCYPPYDLCAVITQAACDSLSGQYFGNGTVCTPLPCPPMGACCLSSGDCIIVHEWDCMQEGGIYQGDGHPCDPNPCVPVTGACCDHATGVCTITTHAACTFDWLGAGVPCNLVTCVPPVPTVRTSWGSIKNIYR